MGQAKHSQDPSRHDGGGRFARKDRFAKLAALFSLAIAVCLTPAQQQAQPPTKFDKLKAWEHLTKQVAFGPRVPMTEGHAKCAEYLLAEMGKYCENVRKQEFSHPWSQTGQPVRMMNLIGEQNWKDAEVRVLLVAHWDTRPDAPKEEDDANAKRPILGANDGASGVAVLLELMRVMKECKPQVGIMYLLTDGEDLGPTTEEMFLGAAHFAQNLPKPKPNYGILLDMVGDKNLRLPIEQNSLAAAPDLVRAFYMHARQVGLAQTFPAEYGPIITDDHLPLNDAGIPTMDLIDFDYPHWHTLRDTPDKCSPDSLDKVGRALETWLLKPKPWKSGA